MFFTEFLNQEWKPALGCTEPAAIAYAAALAASHASGPTESVVLRCDPRVYKNCYAVGIPNSRKKTGIVWATALGALLPNPSRVLESFSLVTDEILTRAETLIRENRIRVEAVPEWQLLRIDCIVRGANSAGRAILSGSHTSVAFVGPADSEQAAMAETTDSEGPIHAPARPLMEELRKMTFAELLETARKISESDRARLREGTLMNLAIASQDAPDSVGAAAGSRVFTGVNARMSGDSRVVMSLAGSGNKGITVAVPLFVFGQEQNLDPRQVEEALALACLMTSRTTHHLGTLSAICGCSNAAGVGLAAGLVYLQGGGAHEISLATNNMVGNIAGMICDGAKIGCALKAVTAVDAAFRSASLAMKGIGIPATDGIVAEDGGRSLENLGRIATDGMRDMDAEILAIMQEKLRWSGH